MPLHVANHASHTRVYLGRASPSGMTCLVQCVKRNQISVPVRNKQLASINTVYLSVHLFTTVHQLSQNSHTHISPSLSNSSLHNSLITTHIQHVRACSSRRAANQASLTIRRLADPLSIIFLGHGDLAPPWL